jgi:diaminopimelate decarboxylase
MDHFHYRDGELCCERVPVGQAALLAGTPCYVYSAATLTDHFARLAEAFAPLRPLICFSVKSCPNLAVLRLLVGLGAGLDCVSIGEVERAWLAGCPMDRVVFAGVGKSDAELRAALDGRFSPLGDPAAAGRGPVGLLNIESESEYEVAARIAGELGVAARAALRINPDVDPRTHRYVATGKRENKFGVDLDRARRFFADRGGDPRLPVRALHMHIGSQIRDAEPFVQAARKAVDLVHELRGAGVAIDTLDIGGGFSADYVTGTAPAYAAYAERIVPLLKPLTKSGVRIVLEPGRSIAASAGVLLTRVEHVKRGSERTFVICDAGMHTLVRPSHYQAFHFCWPVRVGTGHTPPRRDERLDLPGLEMVDVVGPICESGDFLAEGRLIPPVARGDLLAVFTAGAYGMSMASNYNSHPLPAEVLVTGDSARIIRPRQTHAHMLAPETGLSGPGSPSRTA